MNPQLRFELGDDYRSYSILAKVRDALGKFSAGKKEAQYQHSMKVTEAQQNHFAHSFESFDRAGGSWHEQFDKASDNAHHYSHYETHHPKAVEKIAQSFGMTHRHAALDLATHAAEHSGEEHLEGNGAKVRGLDGHKRLGKYVVKSGLEEAKYHEQGK